MVYQMIAIRVKENRIEYYKGQIAKYENLTGEAKETIEARSMKEWIEREARRLGLTHSSDSE